MPLAEALAASPYRAATFDDANHQIVILAQPNAVYLAIVKEWRTTSSLTHVLFGSEMLAEISSNWGIAEWQPVLTPIVL